MKELWKSIDEKNQVKVSRVSHVNRNKNTLDSSVTEIFEDKVMQLSGSRRDFLKLFGFSIASAAVAASCEQPVRKAIPYLIQPEELTPGVANYYASTYFDGLDYCSILVKVREGRPIKIEGNPLSPVTMGGTSARVQASVLELYDDYRYKSPSSNKVSISWDEADTAIMRMLKKLDADKKEIALITPTIISPSTRKAIDDFRKAYPMVTHITYDAVSASAMLEANKISFGVEAIPSYHFDKADIVLSFDADFLGNWLSPVEFNKQYSRAKDLTTGNKRLLKHIHFEPGMTLTGSNADKHVPMKLSDEKNILADIYNKLAANYGSKTFTNSSPAVNTDDYVNMLIQSLGSSIIISGSNDTGTQIIVNAINYLLGNYGKTIDLSSPLLNRQGRDGDMYSLVERIGNGKVGGLIFYDVNPVYDFPAGENLKKLIPECELAVSFATNIDETAEASQYICPDSHFLESWNDAKIKPGMMSLAQPVIRPLFSTRQAQESLLIWAGINVSYSEYIKMYWQENIYNPSAEGFDNFWIKCLHDGVYELERTKPAHPQYRREGIADAFGNINADSENYELSFYYKVGIGSGKHANNPWLQELPDPVTRAAWDNYLCVSPADAAANNWKTGDIVSLDEKIELPILIQPGQTKGTVSAALGYGRELAGKAGEGVGRNLFPLMKAENGNRQNYRTIGNITRTGRTYSLAMTQMHHSMEGRAIIRNASLGDYLKNPSAGNEIHAEIAKKNASIYPLHEYKGHHWGMVIDLNKCTGCSACVIACTAENNVPVVGKNEVIRSHEMHWIRIDRYYEGNPDNPAVYRQPVLCQHCDNAPCENVCPVAATTHSDEGINQMAYNRCIGTRYCNNNCPYKVRRFNWFDYTASDPFKNNTYDPAGMTVDLRRMVLNPDVVVRSKGVIEKCSFCIQRIQEKKLAAKLEDRMLNDGEVMPACQQACPANAIVFGDINDPESKVSKLFRDPRNYHLLEELNTLPSVGYLTKIHNQQETAENPK